jgi:hypothetical protein
MHLDTKHLSDKKALSKEAYEHMRRCAIPLCGRHMMDESTRAPFNAYCNELSSNFGFLSMVLVLLWLSAHG